MAKFEPLENNTRLFCELVGDLRQTHGMDPDEIVAYFHSIEVVDIYRALAVYHDVPEANPDVFDTLDQQMQAESAYYESQRQAIT